MHSMKTTLITFVCASQETVISVQKTTITIRFLFRSPRPVRPAMPVTKILPVEVNALVVNPVMMYATVTVILTARVM